MWRNERETEREREIMGERETAPVVLLAEYAGFSSVSLGDRGISHTHAGCLHWHMGLVQYYSTLPSLFGIVCFASCLHIQTHKLVRTQPLTIQANHRHHGTSLLATGKADAWFGSKTEQRGELWRENATEFQLQKMSSLTENVIHKNQISFKCLNLKLVQLLQFQK